MTRSACNDRGRADVYAAELAAFEGTSYEELVPFDELVAMGKAITSRRWWPHRAVEVVRARSDARSSITVQRGAQAPVVRLAAPQMTRATLIHEFAHALAGVAHGHGPEFRRAHVDLTASEFGNERARWLTNAYRGFELELATRRWPAPHPSSVECSAIAL